MYNRFDSPVNYYFCTQCVFKYLPDISIDFQWIKSVGKIIVNTDIDINYRGVPEHYYPLSGPYPINRRGKK
ncbi:protein of unknown function [Mesotoga infera]|uniref:Uncharacterized protein n=1 Tax=Mesotoga infera TaxID=1236046 RepID=A0A7Z7LFH2_9BACT|nr:protein of unknown function [Mesotoga infera]